MGLIYWIELLLSPEAWIQERPSRGLADRIMLMAAWSVLGCRTEDESLQDRAIFRLCFTCNRFICFQVNDRCHSKFFICPTVYFSASLVAHIVPDMSSYSKFLLFCRGGKVLLPSSMLISCYMPTLLSSLFLAHVLHDSLGNHDTWQVFSEHHLCCA